MRSTLGDRILVGVMLLVVVSVPGCGDGRGETTPLRHPGEGVDMYLIGMSQCKTRVSTADIAN